jgi:hypothetical protein
MTPFPIVQRYEYEQFNAITSPTGWRVYVTPQGHRVPSVTTILGTLPKPGLDKWRIDVGDTEADRIRDEACRIGSTMHETLEGHVSNYLRGRPNIPPETAEDKLAYQMADNMRRFALADLDVVWGIEEAVYCEDLYAGRTDLTGVYDGCTAVIDYKSSRYWKRPEWVEHYKMQIAAYNFCHKTMFGEGMQTGVILIAIRPPCKTPLQRFILNKSDLDRYEDKWLKVVETYYESHPR